MMGTQLAHMEEFATPAAGTGWCPGCQSMMGPSMMGFWGGPGGVSGWQSGFWVWPILGWLTWILIIVALVAFIRWMWKKGDKEK
jgi:hypothetical protein